ncbi:hypothetical protein [Streptomyces sp. MUM 178J]|uniref:hypothetical protein n=1 Tax=Streptomyces sp. MUM 178J TaxID=2791991 RepID=UPI001F036685|nr:hypothetical protein [Streptomyces sp. MUM 178J]WRQ81601.1 hypothetical protein I3F59_020840 [Streptomyces sp. MUM 178J]
MLSFDDVYHAPLGKLKESADDWSEMTTKLERLAEDARTTMAAKAKDEYWRGVNAEVTKPFVAKTAKEFDDAAKAAKGIRQILREGYKAFKKAQDELKKIVDTDAPAQGLVVRSSGKVEARHSMAHDRTAQRDPDYTRALHKQQGQIEALQKRIDVIVEICDDADAATSRALKANVTADKHNFSAPKYKSLDAAEAGRAVGLAKKGRDLTHAELQQLNELLKDNHSSREFARAFYDGLGPRGALEFFGKLSTDTYDYSELDKQRLADVQALQRNLGLNLATATNPAGATDAWTQKWSDEMRKLGTERLPLTKYDYNGPFGYQLLGGIMRYGNYDPKFLNPIAEHVVQLHAENPHRFSENKPIGGWEKNVFNPSGTNGAGYDPVLSMLEALGHSPEAAKQFFSAEPTAYNEDGTVKEGAADLGKIDGDRASDYLTFFTSKEYDSFPDTGRLGPNVAEQSAAYMPDALGHALEAATLGHAWDDPSPELRRDQASVDLMERVVETYAEGAELLKKHHSSMADSLGNMAAGYIDDVNWASDRNRDRSVFAPVGDPAAHARFGQDNVRGFLSTLGQHPDAYAAVSAAERIYSTSALEAQVSPDGQIDQGKARAAARLGAEVQGILDQSRADQIEADGAHRHEEYEKAHANRSAWIEFGVTAGVAAGVAFLPATAAAAGAAAVLVPLAVDTGSGALEQVAGQVIGEWSDQKLEDHQDATDDAVHQDRKKYFRAGEHSAQTPVEAFIDKHLARIDSDFEEDLRDAVITGYGNGNLKEDQQGNSPEAD